MPTVLDTQVSKLAVNGPFFAVMAKFSSQQLWCDFVAVREGDEPRSRRCSSADLHRLPAVEREVVDQAEEHGSGSHVIALRFNQRGSHEFEVAATERHATCDWFT